LKLKSAKKNSKQRKRTKISKKQQNYPEYFIDMTTIRSMDDAARDDTPVTPDVRLSAADQARFAEALLVPPAPTSALVRAFERRAALLVTASEGA
jgi:hypothetical protein